MNVNVEFIANLHQVISDMLPHVAYLKTFICTLTDLLVAIQAVQMWHVCGKVSKLQHAHPKSSVGYSISQTLCQYNMQYVVQHQHLLQQFRITLQNFSLMVFVSTVTFICFWSCLPYTFSQQLQIMAMWPKSTLTFLY